MQNALQMNNGVWSVGIELTDNRPDVILVQNSGLTGLRNYEHASCASLYFPYNVHADGIDEDIIFVTSFSPLQRLWHINFVFSLRIVKMCTSSSGPPQNGWDSKYCYFVLFESLSKRRHIDFQQQQWMSYKCNSGGFNIKMIGVF